MTTRQIVLSIAGFDPSGGAGILADIKTFEQHEVLGFGVCTSITYQTEDKFLGVQWLSNQELLNQLQPLLEQYKISAIKIGLINFTQLQEILQYLPKGIPIVWDPILSATAGFDFDNGIDQKSVLNLLSQISLLTPNLEEYAALQLENERICNILLKGGHQKNHKNDELLLTNGESKIIKGEIFEKEYRKHGTGCVLSSAITSNLAKGHSLEASCTLSKKYIEAILQSNDGLLAYHKNKS